MKLKMLVFRHDFIMRLTSFMQQDEGKIPSHSGNIITTEEFAQIKSIVEHTAFDYNLDLIYACLTLSAAIPGQGDETMEILCCYLKNVQGSHELFLNYITSFLRSTSD